MTSMTCATAHAQHELAAELNAEPMLFGRFAFGLGMAAGWRLQQHPEYGQRAVSPVYITASAAMFRPSTGRVQTGGMLDIATNVSYDGPPVTGLGLLQQWTVTPWILWRIALGAETVPAWLMRVRFGLPVVLTKPFSMGLSTMIGGVHMFRAGMGLSLDVGGAMFAGGPDRRGKRTTHPMLLVEVGLLFEIERLP